MSNLTVEIHRTHLKSSPFNMYKYLPLFLLLLFSCNHIDLVDDEEENTDTNTENTNPSSDEEGDVLSVADIIGGTGQENIVFVDGYIVGYIKGNSLSGAVFGLPSEEINTNFLLSDSPDETDIENIIPVELPRGEMRDELNLLDNPELLGCKIRIEAYATTYFRVNGLKRLYSYELLSDEESEEGSDEPDSESDKGLSLPIDHEALFTGEGR